MKLAMKTTALLLFVVANLFLGSVAGIDQSTNQLEIKIAEVSPSGGVTVEISNSSKSPVRIWRESNSWGAARWRVLRIRKGQLEAFFQNPNQLFTKNNPAFDEIAAGSHIERKLDLNGGNWCGLGHCGAYNDEGFAGQKMNFQPNDTVVVIYDVPRTNEANTMRVWYGVAAALTRVP